MTQATLSSLCDLDIRSIQRIEKGEQNFTLTTLFSIAQSLGVEPGDLIGHAFGR